jgi:hypothetical protein
VGENGFSMVLEDGVADVLAQGDWTSFDEEIDVLFREKK